MKIPVSPLLGPAHIRKTPPRPNGPSDGDRAAVVGGMYFKLRQVPVTDRRRGAGTMRGAVGAVLQYILLHGLHE